MEYKIAKFFDEIKLPFVLKLIMGFFVIFLSVPVIVLPIFPWSLLVWVSILIFGTLIISKPCKVKHVIKIRKSVVYMVSNFTDIKLLRYKWRDIKKDIIKILEHN